MDQFQALGEEISGVRYYGNVSPQVMPNTGSRMPKPVLRWLPPEPEVRQAA